MGRVLECLAKKPPQPVNGEHFAGEEEGVQLRRRERRLRIGDDGEVVIIGPNRKFEPTPEMIEFKKKLDQSRAKAMAALAKLLARTARLPDITALKNFRKLAGDAAYLERACEDAERRAREQFKAEEKRKSGLLLQHREVVHQPMLVSLGEMVVIGPNRKFEPTPEMVELHEKIDQKELDKSRIKAMAVSLEALADGLEEIRTERRAETEAIKAEKRRSRELRRQEWRRSWLDRLAENVKAEASSAYAEDELSDDELQRAHEIAEELSEAETLAAAASTAYAEDLIPEEAFHFLQSVGL